MKKYILPGILTMLLLAILTYSALVEEKAAVIPITAYVGSGTETEQIDCWADPDGVIYLFLPSYTDLKDVLIEKRDDWSVQIELQELSEPMSLAGYALGTPYRLSYGSGNLSCETTLVLMQSENLPAVYIDTHSGKMDYIHARKGNEEPGEIRVYNPDGALCHSGKIERMNGRGNATWEKSEKKPYSIKLQGEADLLEMGSAEKWILLANAQDPSHIRNKLADDLARALGFPYTAQAEWVDCTSMAAMRDFTC